MGNRSTVQLNISRMREFIFQSNRSDDDPSFPKLNSYRGIEPRFRLLTVDQTGPSASRLTLPASLPRRLVQRRTAPGATQHTPTPFRASATVKGLSDKTLSLIRLQDGNDGVVRTGGNNQRAIAYLPKEVGDRFAPPQQQQTSPIGASTATPYALGAGITNNRTGTVMPQQQQPQQAIPTTLSSAVPAAR